MSNISEESIVKLSYFIVPLVFGIAGCSKPADSNRDRTDSRTFDVQEATSAGRLAAPPAAEAMADKAAGPGIGVTAAPGVAFNYRYAFRLPNAKIASVQEEHAQMCEKLGINRCRITGMRYRLENERDISAMLAFKLDPSVARQFGKDANLLVGKAEGMLVDSEITGIDAGAAITQANRSLAQLQDQLNIVTSRLQQKSLSNTEREQLADEAAALRDQMRATGQEKAESKESLATTPMMFNYGSGSIIPGFDDSGSPIRDAFATAVRSFVTMVSFVIMALGALIPWALVGGLVWWIVRRFMPRKTVTE
jgi:hypothetical protein